MTPVSFLFVLLEVLAIILLIIWWMRWSSWGLIWAGMTIPLALGLVWLSTRLFLVPPYQAGCDGLCAGWRGHPYPVLHLLPDGSTTLDGVALVKSLFFYDAILLAFSALIAWLARQVRWRSRRWFQRMIFILIVILIPLATLSMWMPPPQPQLDFPDLRLANNAARAWRWQLHLNGWWDRRLAWEDVRPAPDHVGHRVCFRIYTWFYLPYARAYVDLDQAGVQARQGEKIPLTSSCWDQP